MTASSRRLRRLFLAAGALGALGACGGSVASPEPEPAIWAMFALDSVGGQAVPAAFEAANGDSTVYLEGDLTLWEDGASVLRLLISRRPAGGMAALDSLGQSLPHRLLGDTLRLGSIVCVTQPCFGDFEGVLTPTGVRLSDPAAPGLAYRWRLVAGAP